MFTYSLIQEWLGRVFCYAAWHHYANQWSIDLASKMHFLTTGVLPAIRKPCIHLCYEALCELLTSRKDRRCELLLHYCFQRPQYSFKGKLKASRGNIFFQCLATIVERISAHRLPYAVDEASWQVTPEKFLHEIRYLRQEPPPPLDLGFWSFLTFLHHGIKEVERPLLWKFYEKLQTKSWSNVPPKLLACIGFL